MVKKHLFTYLLLFLVSISSFSKSEFLAGDINSVDSLVNRLMEDGKIPGLSLCMIKDSLRTVRSYGFSDQENQFHVTANTLFELASCSKAFTALSILKLESYGSISLDDNISKYIPWLRFVYKDSYHEVSIKQLLEHKSGISWGSMSEIKPDSQMNALENSIKLLNPFSLLCEPGTKFEYSSVNYDILGYLVESVSGKTYDKFMKEEIFSPLNMNNTFVQTHVIKDKKSKGYKIGFFEPINYNPPLYLGNVPAGYIISDAEDMLKWLSAILNKTTILDEQINKMITDEDSINWDYSKTKKYLNGWYYSRAKSKINHFGMNPNFTSYIILDLKKKIGVCIMANSNSNYTHVIGNEVFDILRGEKVNREYPAVSTYDFEFSLCSIVMAIILLLMLVYLSLFIIELIKRKRIFQLPGKKVAHSFVLLLCSLLLSYGIYLLPKGLQDFTWEAAIVWSPFSFRIFVILTYSAIFLGFLLYNLALFFPHRNEIYGSLPMILSASIISGLSNISIIFIITTSFSRSMDYKLMILFIVIAFVIFVVSKRVTNIKLIKISSGYLHKLRMKLVNKLLFTSNYFFDKVSNEFVLTVLNDDVSTLGNIITLSTKLITNFIILISAFIYLAILSPTATLITLCIILALSLLYFIISRGAKRLMELVRKTKDVYIRYVNHIIFGHKELSINSLKKEEFCKDVTGICEKYRDTIITSKVKFTNASIFGQAFILVAIASVCILIPIFLPQLSIMKIIPIIMVLLYCVGPINFILSSVSTLIQLRIAWKRIKSLEDSIEKSKIVERERVSIRDIKKITLEEVSFKYDAMHSFKLGPINLSLNAGEITFIIGGNGSGKSTFAKVLTGCYNLTGGKFKISQNEIEYSDIEIGECFAAIFNPFHLFDKMYAVDISKKKENLKRYMNDFELEEIVQVDKNNKYSNLKLSSGQRKRLALIQILLEDKPIYLFDEWAADQDPHFKKYFYTEILPILKKMGKVVLAITHDDNYFSFADRIIKLNYGKIEIDTYNTEHLQILN